MTELQPALSILTCPHPAISIIFSAQTALCPTTKTNLFTFALDQFSAAGRALLTYAEEHPYLFGLFLLMIVAGLVTIIVPIAMGFHTPGIVAGSMAAAWQASIGNVAAGSFIAILQALTMKGTLVTIGGVLIGGGTAGIVGGAAWEWARKQDWSKHQDWAMWVQVAGLNVEVAEQLERSVEWVVSEGWKWTEGVRNVDWEGAGESAEWIGREAWRVTDEGVRSVDWEGLAKGAESVGKEGFKWAEEGVKKVDWEGAANSVEWVGREAWRMTDEGVRSVDWEGLAKGAESVGREGWKMAEEVLSDVDWEEAGESVKRVFTSWW